MANYMAATNSELQSFNNTYTNSRYAPRENHVVGKPFPSYKEFGGRFTDWRSSGLRDSTLRKRYNLPTNNNFFRTSLEAGGVNVGDTENRAWVNQTQTLANVSGVYECNNNADCDPYPGTKCNPNYENWPDAAGNQSGGYCSRVLYPELVNEMGQPVDTRGGGTYTRKNVNEGGIGRSCVSDRDCGQGYACNTNFDFVGKNIQQSGYCAKTYTCPDGSKHYLGTPYNASIPVSPPPEQNLYGNGYDTFDQCNENALPQQDCVQGGNGKFFATYPGYCPVNADLRHGRDGTGAVVTTSPQQLGQGIQIPQFATNMQSQIGSPYQAFSTWVLPGTMKSGSKEAFQYAQELNPIPTNLFM